MSHQRASRLYVVLDRSCYRWLLIGWPVRMASFYWQAGSPSPAEATIGFVVFTPIPQLKPPGICVCEVVAYQEPVPGTIVGEFTPVEFLNSTPPAPVTVVVNELYLDESAKNASSAVTRLRRSDFIAAVYAFVFVLANFGIAIAAKMPMMTTTIKSSMRVKPLRMRFMIISRDSKGVTARSGPSAGCQATRADDHC